MDTTRQVTIAGSLRQLRFDLLSLCRMQEEHGINVLNPDTWIPSPKLTSVLVWGGLVHSDPKLALADVIKSIPLKELTVYHNKAHAALNEDMPEVATKEDEVVAGTVST